MQHPGTRQSNPLWGEDWGEVRKRWSLDPGIRHLNHGAYGAVPLSVRRVQRALLRRIDANPTAYFGHALDVGLATSRQRAAAFVGADPAKFALVRNASTGITAVANSLQLRPGEEILCTSLSFVAVRNAFSSVAARAGAALRVAEVPVTNDDAAVVAGIESLISERTRLIVVDAITSPSAMVMPVDEIVTMAHSHGVPVFVDAAQAPGNMAVDLGHNPPDFWVGDFHKWLCAPHGAAGLYVDGDPSRIVPVVKGDTATQGFPESMSREGVDDYTGMLMVPAALDFIESLGAVRLREHNHALATYGGDVVRAALRTAPVPCRFAGFAAVRLPRGVAETPPQAAALQSDIAGRLRTSVTVAPGLLRLSAFAYNAPGEYDAFAAELGDHLSL